MLCSDIVDFNWDRRNSQEGFINQHLLLLRNAEIKDHIFTDSIVFSHRIKDCILLADQYIPRMENSFHFKWRVHEKFVSFFLK